MQTFDAVLNNARGIGVKTGAQIEREIVAQTNRASTRQCECGCGKLRYKHSTGGWHGRCGSLYRGNGQRLR
jgi:hypothetical protein